MAPRMTFPLTRAWRSIAAALFSLAPGLRCACSSWRLSCSTLWCASCSRSSTVSRPFFLPWRIVPALLIGALFDLGAATFFLAPFRRAPRVVAGALSGPRLRIPSRCCCCRSAASWCWSGAAELVFLERVRLAFQLHRGRLPHLHQRGDRQYPRVLQHAAAVCRLWAAFFSRAVVGDRPQDGSACLCTIRRLGVCSRAVGALDNRAISSAFRRPRRALQGVLLGRAAQTSSPATATTIFWHAFRTNEIDYERFYRTLPPERAAQVLAHELDPARPAAEVSAAAVRAHHHRRGPEKRLNVVLISVEALSAEFLLRSGNRGGTDAPARPARRRKGCCLRASTRPARVRCGGWRR